MTPSFCANCTEPHPALVLRGSYWLCPSCDPESESPRRSARRGPERGYDVPEKHAPLGQTHVAFARAAARVAGPAKFGQLVEGTTASAHRPGFVMVRVPRRRADGSTMDAREARETLRGEPWFKELQHRGSTRQYHLFDRPDVDLAREVRSTPNVDPLEALRDAIEAAAGTKERSR